MRLSMNIADDEAIPYFLWDEPITVAELKRRLASGDHVERSRWAGKVLREARYDEAIALVPLAQILADYPHIQRHLGRRRKFWDFLIGEWRRLGLVH